jgi:hypothetical protein
MKKSLICIITAMLFACAGSKSSLEKMADDIFYVSFICTSYGDAENLKTACQEWNEKHNKLTEAEKKEVTRIGSEKYQIMVEKVGKFLEQRKEEDDAGIKFLSEAPAVLSADCNDCSELLKKAVDTVQVLVTKCENDQQLPEEECLKLGKRVSELNGEMSLDDEKKIFEIQYQKLMKY